jgi:hypothetical protein
VWTGDIWRSTEKTKYGFSSGILNSRNLYPYRETFGA